MQPTGKTILSLAFSLTLSTLGWGQVNVVPEPQSITAIGGTHTHSPSDRIVTKTDKSLPREGYTLEISDKVTITSSSKAGEFYARQTLSQIAGGDPSGNWTAPRVKISDYPRFGYRGLMVDVVRCFVPKEDLLKIIDAASRLKINTLHLHLCDDNGWRIEIKSHPELAKVGSRRVDRPGKLFPERENQKEGEPTVEGGYYTQDDIREIVRYASERFIDVIPEIEMPAHSNAALAAYPSLACPVVEDFIGVLPGIGGSHADIIYCAGNDDVFRMLYDVVDEVASLFPSRYIHIGGDEAVKTNWKKCPLCQKRIKDNGLSDEEALQGWFMEKVASHIRSKGKVPMGWDEVTNSEIPEGMVVYGWQGKGKAAEKALAKGHKVVMTPAKVMYLIRYQGPQWFEPPTYFGNVTLKDVFDFEPVGENWPDGWKDNLLGIQGSMWTEFCSDPSDVEYMIFPRLLSVSEVGWTLPRNKNWGEFIKGVDRFTPTLDKMGITWARSMYNIQHTVYPDGDRLRVELDCIRPDVKIKREVSPDGSHLSAYAEKDGKKVGKTLELNFLSHKAVGCKVSGGGELGYVLTNGVRGSKRCSDFEWTVGNPPFDNSFTVDLGRQQEISSVTLGLYNNYGMGCHKPSKIEVSVSSDGKSFTRAAVREFTSGEIFLEGTFPEDVTLPVEGRVRFIRCTLTSPGVCPKGHVREGLTVKVYADEIIVH